MDPTTEHDALLEPSDPRDLRRELAIILSERWDDLAIRSWRLEAAMRLLTGPQYTGPRSARVNRQAEDIIAAAASIIEATVDGISPHGYGPMRARRQAWRILTQCNRWEAAIDGRHMPPDRDHWQLSETEVRSLVSSA